MKVCYKCRQEKEAGDFHKDKTKQDGLRSQCKECVKEYQSSAACRTPNARKKYYVANKRVLSEISKLYTAQHKEEKAAYNKEYYYRNKIAIQEKNGIWRKQKYAANTDMKLKVLLRRRLGLALQKNTKLASAVKDMGCTLQQLKTHLESQFKPGMTWENHGRFGWHIDHIKALSRYKLTNKEEQLRAIHFTNLQPLWWKDNVQKGNK